MNTPAPKTRREQAEEAAKKYAYDGDLDWNDPETAAAVGTAEQAYLQGWTDADSTPAPSEQGDEEWIDSRVMELMGDGYNTESQGVERAVRKVMLREGIARARRAQNAEIRELRALLERAKMHFGQISRCTKNPCEYGRQDAERWLSDYERMKGGAG